MDEKVVDYVQKEISKGYSQNQIRSVLLKKGWKQEIVDEALFLASAPDAPKSSPVGIPGKSDPTEAKTKSGIKSVPVKAPMQSNARIQFRNPYLVLIFSLITFGIYTIFWLVYTTNELRGLTKSAPETKMLWLLLVPIVNYIVIIMYFWKYSKAINELTGFNNILLFIMWLVFSPVGIVISQIELNKKANA